MPSKILIIEDDPILADHLALLLRRGGYAADLAAPGAGVMRRILASHNRQPLAAILLDLYLPEPDGFQLLHFCREVLESVPVVGMSGVSAALLQIMAARGAAAVIEKPIMPARLLAALRQLIDAAPSPVAQI